MRPGPTQKPALVLTVLLLLGASACAKKTVQTSDPTPTAPTAQATEPATPAPPAAEAPKPPRLSDIFFDFDQSRLRQEAITTLNENGRMLREDPSLRMVLEGHCDERGTVEYNLALGERRARAAKDYLVSYGIDGGRLSTVSFGEERPFAPGHDETAWAQNRRVHFVQGGQPGSQADRVR